MTTSVTLVRTGPYAGQISGSTNINSNSWGLGFTGGVYVVFLNADGAVVYVSHLHTWGVDAKGNVFGTSLRTPTWLEQMPAALAPQVTQMQIVQQHTPQDLSAILGRIASQYTAAKALCILTLGPGCPL